MKRTLIAMVFAMAVLATGCDNKRQQLQKEIDTLNEKLSMVDIASEDDAAFHLVELLDDYATQYPNDSLAPVYLMQAGEIEMNLDHADQSIDYFNRVIENYPDFVDVPMCVLMKGRAFELDERYDDARDVYEDFVATYPDHYMAHDIAASLPYVGMSNEEQLNMILSQKNAEQDQLAEKK